MARISDLTGSELAQLSQDAADYESAKNAAMQPHAEWLPIGTAPRDGTRVLLLVDFDYGPDVRGAAWSLERTSVIAPGYDGYSGPGWVDVENGWVNFEDRGILGWRPADTTEPEGR